MLYPEFDELVSFKNLKLGRSFSRRNASSIILGGHHSSFRGQGLEFDAVRKYVPGDDIRHLDWRVTARTGSPHLKIFLEEKQRHLYLCIDMNANMRFGTRSTFKSVQAARVASLLGWQGHTNHDPVSSFLFGDVPNGIEYFPSKHKQRSFLQLLKRMSETPIEKHQVSILEALRHMIRYVQKGALVYLISDFMDIHNDQEHNDLILQLNQKADLVFVSVNDPADQRLLPVGSFSACSYQQEQLIINSDSLLGREAYALQWRENRKILHQQKISLIEISTETAKNELWTILQRFICKRHSK